MLYVYSYPRHHTSLSLSLHFAKRNCKEIQNLFWNNKKKVITENKTSLSAVFLIFLASSGLRIGAPPRGKSCSSRAFSAIFLTQLMASRRFYFQLINCTRGGSSNFTDLVIKTNVAIT